MKLKLIGFLVLVMGAAVKAHVHFIRLAMLAAMGLAGMWMMHKLAQDWQKINNNNKPAAMAGKLLGLWKRSIPDVVSGFLIVLLRPTIIIHGVTKLYPQCQYGIVKLVSECKLKVIERRGLCLLMQMNESLRRNKFKS